jgi:hypothetical protein
MAAIWKVSRTDYDIDPDGSGQVKVTNLHWRATLIEGEFTASSYGSAGDDQNRVYPLPALENVPESVVVGWVQDALGEEEVARIEQSMVDNIAEQKTPTSGGITY